MISRWLRTVEGDRQFEAPALALPHEHPHVGLPPEKFPAAPIGPPDDVRAGLVTEAVRRGYADRLLLSHDALALQLLVDAREVRRSWTTLFESFVPRLIAAGLDNATMERITAVNPLLAFGFAQNPS